MSETGMMAYQEPTLDVLVAAWLHAKRGRTDSAQTEKRYRTDMASFRQLLQSQGIDLDGPPLLVAAIAQGWAARSTSGSMQRVSAASFGQRIGIISSFYRYVLRMGFARFEQNPMQRVDRPPVPLYANVQPMTYQEVKQQLAAIDTSELVGLRDKTLLMLALTTGRRLSEVAGMRRDHLSYNGQIITVTFPRAKGGKVMRDKLTRSMSVMLDAYLRAVDASWIHHDPQAIWISVSPHNRGGAIHVRSIEHICLQRLGTEHFHALRHTFAHAMEQAGAKVSEIQSRLGHSSLATTGRYLAQLASDENPYASAIEALFTDDAEE